MQAVRCHTPAVSREFDHVLLTRFSAVLHDGAPPVGDEWLYYRLAFFIDACHASVTSQRGAVPFDWLVLLDDRCSEEFRDDIEQLAEGAFTPIWTHEPFRRDSFAQPVADLTAAADGGPAPHLITTRIDSDDAMAVDFMAAVQGQFAAQQRLFVNFTRGVQIDRTGAVYLSDTLSSPFLSLIERREQGRLPATVYVAKHARARAHGPIREVSAPVMWAQVVHGINLSNIVNGTQVSPQVLADRFDMALGYDAGLGGRRLLTARARHAGRLARLWAAHPGELTKFAEARAWRLRGTHQREQDDGATLTDRVQEWVRDTRERVASAKLEARRKKWRLQRRLNTVAPQRLTPVAGDVEAVLAADRVVVMAEWALRPQVRDCALEVARAYAAAGWPTLVVAARDGRMPVRAGSPVGPGVAVVRRPNLGYDFGSWSAALATYPGLAEKPLVVLTNDSLLGPAGPLDELLRRIEASKADIWSATDNRRPTEHLQSYLLAFRDGALAREPLAGFFASVSPRDSKGDVVRSYEFGLTAIADAHGLSREVGWSKADLGIDDATESAYASWRELLDAGFPFVKRALVEVKHLAGDREAVLARLRTGRLSRGTAGPSIH